MYSNGQKILSGTFKIRNLNKITVFDDSFEDGNDDEWESRQDFNPTVNNDGWAASGSYSYFGDGSTAFGSATAVGVQYDEDIYEFKMSWKFKYIKYEDYSNMVAQIGTDTGSTVLSDNDRIRMRWDDRGDTSSFNININGTTTSCDPRYIQNPETVQEYRIEHLPKTNGTTDIYIGGSKACSIDETWNESHNAVPLIRWIELDGRYDDIKLVKYE